MNTYIEKLTNLLLEKNEMLSYIQAKTWVELLWGILKRPMPKQDTLIKAKK